MSVPDRTLEISLDVKQVKLKELRIFSETGLQKALLDGRFSEFLGEHSNWTADEVDNLTIEELEQVAQTIGEKLRANFVPLAKPPG